MTNSAQQKTEGQRFWDTHPCGGQWTNYAEYMAWIQRAEPYGYSIVGQYDWTQKRDLDIGCGQGALANYLPRLGATVVGVDMSAVSLLRTMAGAAEVGNVDRVRLSAADAGHLPFPTDCFDAVSSMGVLHHTPDTRKGVQELHRVLIPGGLAIVMLYRSGNPKWWMTWVMRGLSRLVYSFTREPQAIANRLRARHRADDRRGTALMELFGVPVLKAFSNRQACQMFGMFSEIRISNHQPGFGRMVVILPWLKPIGQFLQWFDRRVKNMWGFYQVIEARK